MPVLEAQLFPKLLCRLRTCQTEKKCVNVSYEGRALWCKICRTHEGKTELTLGVALWREKKVERPYRKFT